MTGPKLNEAPVLRSRAEGAARSVPASGQTAKAVGRYVRMSAYKARQVLDLIRGHEVGRAQEILRFCERGAADVVGKVLASAVANGEKNHSLAAEELFVSACFADEGPTLKRWRPRARGRATRIRKRTCHVTVVVSRLPERELQQRRAARAQTSMARRSRPSRRRRQDEASVPTAPVTARDEAAPATAAGPGPVPAVTTAEAPPEVVEVGTPTEVTEVAEAAPSAEADAPAAAGDQAGTAAANEDETTPADEDDAPPAGGTKE